MLLRGQRTLFCCRQVAGKLECILHRKWEAFLWEAQKWVGFALQERCEHCTRAQACAFEVLPAWHAFSINSPSLSL